MKRFLLLSLIFCGLSLSTLFAQTTAIPDTAFEAKLIQLGIDSDGIINGQVLTADVANLTFLDVSGTSSTPSNIHNLTGIEDFVNLQTLLCNFNSLSSLDVSANITLDYLFCSSNNLSILDVSANTNLVQLVCSSNNLSTLNTHTTLQSLYCAHNNLSTLDLSNNTALQTLHCDNNNLSTLDLSNNTALQALHCDNNSLSTLDLSNNTNLQSLHCSLNNLSTLDLSNNTNLQILSSQDNILSTLNISNNIALQSLYCNGNNLSTLGLSNNIALHTLHCDDNSLSTLDLSNNIALHTLHCDGNSLSTLNVSNNIALHTLYCDDNNLSTLDVSINTNLQTLYCDFNNLSTLDLSNNTNLQSLHCSLNNLSTLDLSNNTNLQILSCGANNLSTLDLSNNTNLQSLYFSYGNLSTLDLSNNHNLTYLRCNNNQLTHLNLQNGNNSLLSTMNAQYNDPNLIICIDDAYQTPLSTWQKDLTASYSDICKINLEGILAHDTNIDCSVDSTELPLRYHIIEATNLQTGIKKYTTSKTFGRYGLGLDTGSYTIAPIPKNSYWAACVPAQTITIDTSTVVDTLNLPIQETVSCPLLTVSLSAPFLRATGGGSNYTVYYCNDGTAEAPNAYIEVVIDAGLIVSGTSIPFSNQSGNLYTFSMDTLDIGECGNFTINVVADSNLLGGHTLCSEAHIYPDNICLPIWNDAIVEASATCQVDTIAFKLRNTGSNMLIAQNYTIFEDDIIVRMDSFRLNGGDSIIIKQGALPSKIYRIEANQPLGFPAALGAPIAHTTVTNCNTISSNLGILPQFYTGNSAPFTDVDCQQLIAAYDPNDKQAQPKGYGVNHYLLPNLPIDYKVRFQNTGNDTAFLVVVIDTLSPHIDVTSIKMGASSHPYTWELKGSGILVVTFEDIKLVDSTTNEPLSNGFFTYSIQQQADLPTGTIINNQASIYFDYNPPISTNTTFHTIARYFYTSRLTIDTTICEMDSFLVNGTLVDTTGTYTEILSGATGQDSTIIWSISVTPSPALFYSDTLCNSATINGITYDTSGTFTQLLVSTIGCDTLLTIDLIITHNSDTSLNITTCDSFALNGFIYTNSGVYTQTINNTLGCDSLITLNLNINHSNDTTINISTCDSFALNGFIYTNSGVYTQNINNTLGCDSLITLNLNINHSNDTTINISTCDSFTLNGFIYTNSGTYTQTINNTLGCDSLITLNLNINHSNDTTINISTCDSFTLNGFIYTNSGVYIQNINNTLGCDSLITLNLNINHSNDTTINISTCDSFILNGFIYTNSGTYTQTINNTLGCDSLITLNLNINHSNDTTINISTCDSFTLNGFIYTNSGTYTQTINNTLGCDSLITLNLNINHSNDTTINISTCDSFTLNGFIYTNSGVYTQTINNTLGCDSLITVILLVESIDSTLSLNGITLTSNELGASYQWLDCNNNFSPITGATNQHFTPIQSGDYAVAITKNNCSLISTCESITVVDINRVQTNTEIGVYPNPTTGKVNIDLRNIHSHTSIEIFSANGQKVQQQQTIQNQQQTTLDLSTVPSGLYLLRIHTETKSYHLKLIKE